MRIEDRVELSELLTEYGGLLTDKQREITHLYCELDLSLGEVSDEYGISRQAVRDAINHSAASLEAYEQILGNLRFKSQLSEVLKDYAAGGASAEDCLKRIAALTEG